MTTPQFESDSSILAVRRIREQFGAAECAALLRVDPAKIHRWASGSTMSHVEERHVADLALIGEIFSGAERGPTALPWLHAMSPALQYDTPADEILRGRWITAVAAARDYVRT